MKLQIELERMASPSSNTANAPEFSQASTFRMRCRISMNKKNESNSSSKCRTSAMTPMSAPSPPTSYIPWIPWGARNAGSSVCPLSPRLPPCAESTEFSQPSDDDAEEPHAYTFTQHGLEMLGLHKTQDGDNDDELEIGIEQALTASDSEANDESNDDDMAQCLLANDHQSNRRAMTGRLRHSIRDYGCFACGC